MAEINAPISNNQLIRLRCEHCMQLPENDALILRLANGFVLENGVVIYSSDEVVERNETFEVAKYAPNFFAIGDDSGGRSILIPFDGLGVYLVDQGSMKFDDFKMIGGALAKWIEQGCLL